MYTRLRQWLGAAVVFVISIGLPVIVETHLMTWELAAVAVIGCAALTQRARRPLPVLLVALTCSLVSMALTGFAFPIALMTLVALYQVGMSCPLRLVVVSTGISTVAVFFTVQLVRNIESFDLASVNELGWFITAAAAGFAEGNHRRLRAASHERALRAEESREAEARRRVSEERLRIAQELHDAVGHSIAVINIQSGVAAHVIGTQPVKAQQALELIRGASSEAMEEIRTTLGLLRTADQAGTPVGPAPQLDDVPTLVDRARASGLAAEYTLHGQVREVPVVIGTTVFRLVQEALTNTVKHAGPGTRVQVEVAFLPGSVRVRVEDDGAGIGTRQGGSGFGLRGMRERVEAIAGTLEISHLQPRGFRLVAHIPTEAP
ncbi:sensor histidine kinase [Streptomyces sp. NPDC003023]|uniref:sensor histidine kinase n=1 Tax=Streptomyces sp. NPDC003023 TaxID=3364675 RepID=UPI00368600AB